MCHNVENRLFLSDQSFMRNIVNQLFIEFVHCTTGLSKNLIWNIKFDIHYTD